MNIIEAKNLNKYFHEPATFHVLKNVSFGVERGKMTSITGKSGSGKSTLLYLLSTMDTDFEVGNPTTEFGSSQDIQSFIL